MFCKSHLILTRLGHLSQRCMGQKRLCKAPTGKYKPQDSYPHYWNTFGVNLIRDMIKPITNSFQLFDFNKRDDGLDNCSVYDGASVINFVFLILISFGIVISYLPQYRRIFIKLTSEGLSTNFYFWARVHQYLH